MTNLRFFSYHSPILYEVVYAYPSHYAFELTASVQIVSNYKTILGEIVCYCQLLYCLHLMKSSAFNDSISASIVGNKAHQLQ